MPSSQEREEEEDSDMDEYEEQYASNGPDATEMSESHHDSAVAHHDSADADEVLDRVISCI